MEKKLKFLFIIISIIVSSCSSSVIYVSKDEPFVQKKEVASSKIVKKERKSFRGDRSKVVESARSFIGTKYKFGGNKKSGIDCSGLTYNSYLNGLGIKIPRVANDQYKKSTVIANPKPGDLVFFKISSWFKIDHVGIYTGNNNMIHASKKYGVIEVSLNKEYYQKRLVGFGRIIK